MLINRQYADEIDAEFIKRRSDEYLDARSGRDPH